MRLCSKEPFHLHAGVDGLRCSSPEKFNGRRGEASLFLLDSLCCLASSWRWVVRQGRMTNSCLLPLLIP